MPKRRGNLEVLETTSKHILATASLPSLSCTLSAPVLRDTARLSQRYPAIARYEVFGVSTWPIGCDIPSPPLESMRRCRISALLARYHMKTRKNGCDATSAELSRKGITRYGRGSRGPLRLHTKHKQTPVECTPRGSCWQHASEKGS